MRIPRRLANLYPPFLGAGIRVEVSADFSWVRASLKWRWWNRNYVGTQFGGSIYMMSDPFYMVMLLERLGRGYTVWLTEANVRYLRPGRSELHCEFRIDDERVERIRAEADAAGTTTTTLPVVVRDGKGEAVAEVVQTLYVRARHFVREQEGAPAASAPGGSGKREAGLPAAGLLGGEHAGARG